MEIISLIYKQTFYKLFKIIFLVITCLITLHLVGCKKDNPECTNCNTDNKTQPNSDIRDKYVGTFKVKYRYKCMDNHDSWNNADTTYTVIMAVSYNSTDSLKDCMNFITCTTMPTLIFTKLSANSTYLGFHGMRKGILNGKLYDASPFNRNGFINPDSINYTYDAPMGHKHTIETIVGSRF